MSQHLPDVTPTEDPGGGKGGKMSNLNIMNAVAELQSLVEWTSQRKGVKEDASIVNEKLRQLDKIRKELEKSAKQAQMTRQQTQTNLISDESVHTDHGTDQIQKSSADLTTVITEKSNIEDFGNTVTFPLICDQDIQTKQHEDSEGGVPAFPVCAMDDSFHLEDLPPPVEELICDSALEENDLYIDFVSAKEKIDKLTMNLEESDLQTTEKVNSGHHTTEEPDSLGTAISEDEGLGEESRRADSTGSISYLDIHTSEEDLVNTSAGTSSSHFEKEPVPTEKSESVWITDPGDPRLSLELCRCTIYKLKECLKAKEAQLKRIRDEQEGNDLVKSLKMHLNNLKNEMEEVKSQLEVSQKENTAVHEQVLELEEAENDSRRQCQRYEEKLLFLQEKDAHFQAEFTETKHTLEMCMDTLTAKDTKEKELRAQIKYMEVLVQKYEDQVKGFEASEFKLKERLVDLEEELLKIQTEKSDVVHKGTQTYPEKTKRKDSPDATSDCSEKQCSAGKEKRHSSKSRFPDSGESHSKRGCYSDASSRRSSTKSLPGVDVLDEAKSCEVAVQVNMASDITESSTQTEVDEGEDKTYFSTTTVSPTTELLFSESPSSIQLDSTLSTSCPFQQELYRRLHHLVEEDAQLQQQLHHMDQINLTLWQKLHNLEFHIGECKRENFQHHSRMSESSRSSEITSPMNNPSHVTSPRFTADKTLDAGEEEYFISSGRTIGLDSSEDGLRDRLLRLDQINTNFEAELRNREKLYQKKEQKHKEWMEAEDRFTCDIRYLQMEKNSLLSKVTQLEAEKQRMTNRLKTLEEELSCLQERHNTQVALMVEEHEALVSELRNRIELLTKREKEYVGQIANLRMEKKASSKKEAGENNELSNLKASYVQLQIELSQNRGNMVKMESDFEERLQALKQRHFEEESRLQGDLQRLKGKEFDFDEQMNSYQKRQSELEAALKDKEQQLEEARLEFREQLLAMEEEHKVVETELNRKLRQMEESTALATKALTEEKSRLERELQDNLYDLRTKEEQYKSRIAELESNVSQLHDELRRLTGDLDAGFPDCEGVEFPPFQKERLQKQLQELQRREGDLREKLEEMEQKEAAYRETLENADRIVASVERGYKNKIEELEMSERSLKQRVNNLEEIESKLRVALHRERRSSDGRKPDDLVLELMEAEVRENSLKERIESLEQNQRATIHRLKDLEKMRETLESKMADHEEITSSLKIMQHEQDVSKKELGKLRMSESGLRLALQQAEGVLKNRETAVRTEVERMQEEKKDLEETIHQLRMQVRQLQALVDRTQEEETSGETLGDTVQRSSSLEVTTCKGTPSTESGQSLTSAPEDEDGKGDVADEKRMKAGSQKCVTFREHQGSSVADSEDPSMILQDAEAETLSLEVKNNADKTCTESSPDSAEAPNETSQEADEQDKDFMPPTIEFFLPEPKKQKYEVIETKIPESTPVQEVENPVSNLGARTDTSASSAPASSPGEQPSHSEMDESVKSEISGDVQSAVSQTESDNVHSDPVLEKGAQNSRQDFTSAHQPPDSKNVGTSGESAGEKEPQNLNTSEGFVSESSDRQTSQCAEASAGKLHETCSVLVDPHTAETSSPQGSPDPETYSDVDSGTLSCDVQLLTIESPINSPLDQPPDGSSAEPSDSILKLLRGLRPASEDPSCTSAQPRAKIRSLLRQNMPEGAKLDVPRERGERKPSCIEEVDWLKVAEESATSYAQEKMALEEELKRVQDRAQAAEREKEEMKESMKKVEDLENLREVNSKLQEQVALLQKRLEANTKQESIRPKREEPKQPASESPTKKEEEKAKEKPKQPAGKGAGVSWGSGASGGERSSTTSPPPVDECRKERMELEENMIRAMVAMQFDMQQKKAAQRMNSSQSGRDTSSKEKDSKKEDVVAMGACAAEAKEDCSGSAERPNVYSPYNFRVIQQVGSDTVLVGWEHAHPDELEGFEVYVNGALHETVYTPDRTKAVISGLDLQKPLTLSVCAISSFGEVSEPRLLQLPLKASSKDGFFFLDDDDDEYDDIFFGDEDLEKQTRPISMEW